MDREIPLREGAFLFAKTALSSPLDKRNARDKAKGLCITSERYIGELGARYLSTITREQDSPATVSHYDPLLGRSARGRDEGRATTSKPPPYLQAVLRPR